MIFLLKKKSGTTTSMGKLLNDFLERGKKNYSQISDSVLLTGTSEKMIQILRVIT